VRALGADTSTSVLRAAHVAFSVTMGVDTAFCIGGTVGFLGCSDDMHNQLGIIWYSRDRFVD